MWHSFFRSYIRIAARSHMFPFVRIAQIPLFIHMKWNINPPQNALIHLAIIQSHSAYFWTNFGANVCGLAGTIGCVPCGKYVNIISVCAPARFSRIFVIIQQTFDIVSYLYAVLAAGMAGILKRLKERSISLSHNTISIEIACFKIKFAALRSSWIESGRII